MPGAPGYCGSLTLAELEAIARRSASYAEIAARAHVEPASVYYHLRKLGLTGTRGGDRQSEGWAARRASAFPPPRTA